MSILVNKETRLLVQGITGREGAFHTEQMIAYGTPVVAGVTPGKGGSWGVGNVPIFETVHEAVTATGANTSIIYVPAKFAPDAVLEAADAGVPLIICITEGIPALDMMRVRAYLDTTKSRLIGPNCPGLITPGEAKVGIMPGHIHTRGRVGVVSRSGTLTYEVVYALTLRGIGQSTAVGIGGDPINGTSFVDVLKLFENDPETRQVVMIGEIGGTDEEKAAEFIATRQDRGIAGGQSARRAPSRRDRGDGCRANVRNEFKVEG
ncbi:MAG: succinate--CoA ligase subunit alpha [Anaerolineae bacterium]|nr:succinate--CoA ligase subunit alpha [Anaerolineae bacterium]